MFELADAEKLGGRRVVASISGGKDSAAMSLALTEAGIDHDRCFMDTGWEHWITYAYVLPYADALEAIIVACEYSPDEAKAKLGGFVDRYGEAPLQKKLGPITRLIPKRRMVELVEHKGMFMSRTHRFCTQELKIKPMQAHIDLVVAAGGDVVNAVGIRGAESGPRSKMTVWEWSDGFDCETWRPIFRYGEADVIATHTRHGLLPNPLYLQGASRVGCWPCVFARKRELRMLADDGDRVDLIRRWQRRVRDKAAARYAAKGETFESQGYLEPQFFQRMVRSDADRMWPIDKVLAWAKTDYGGRQYELFAGDGEEAGCMRWGLCETDDPDPAPK